MSENNEPLWASGPGEILRHGIGLLSDDTDTNRRLAMISIDNAVELMMKTVIQLPARITGINVSRRQRDDICATFPNLLDGIEAHANDKIVGISLGEIEWFHRLRNELYHQGNGLTVERRQVEVYAELALTLFRGLFGVRPDVPEKGKMHTLGEFLEAYVSIEQALRNASNSSPSLTSGILVREFIQNAILDERELQDFEKLRLIRNQVVHTSEGSDLVTPDLVNTARKISQKLNKSFPGKNE